MKVTPTRLKEVLVVEPAVHGDERGFFLESWHQQRYLASGIRADFVQDNHSRSVQGTLRGLHYQLNRPQGKLVWVVAGEVFDVAVDLRRSSPGFGKWAGVLLSAENKRLAWIPEGFAHGFLVLSDSADFLYEASDYYAPQHERCVIWSDLDIGIEWPLAGEPVLTAKDRAGLPLRDAETYP